MLTSRLISPLRLFRAGLFLGALGLSVGPTASAEETVRVSGRELFLREWLPNDSRSHGGDGLGPQFNDSSCVGCHNQGGPGGAGPEAKNVQLISAFRSTRRGASNKKKRPSSATSTVASKSKETLQAAQSAGKEPAAADDLFGDPAEDPFSDAAIDAELAKAKTEKQPPKVQREREALAQIHPELRRANGFVLHRFSVAPGYSSFLRNAFGMEGGMAVMGMMPVMSDPFGLSMDTRRPSMHPFTLFRNQMIHVDGVEMIVSERNTSALFGAGQINSIPDSVLITAAQQKFSDFPDVSGRVAKLKDGRLGRFGWKAQKASLRDFVMTACAVELGLEVPTETQSFPPQKPAYEAPGLDLNKKECDAMVAFVANLPAPVMRTATSQSELELIRRGREHFDSVGCSVCHTPNLGSVQNVFSDLLLHDMGPILSDSGMYGGMAPNSSEDFESIGMLPELTNSAPKPSAADDTQAIGATRREWRTPPLWGVRDSAPYLHDGRAATLEQAIAQHGGEGTLASQKFFELDEPERLEVAVFLRSLIAPQN